MDPYLAEVAHISAVPPSPEGSIYKSAPSTPIVSPMEKPISPLDSGCPTEQERERALVIFENRDNEIGPGTAAAWLGESGSDRERIRKAYMEVFDWANLDILAAMRNLCDRIALKGETQQIDRILYSFSKRWCECNANHGFKSTGKLSLCLRGEREI